MNNEPEIGSVWLETAETRWERFVRVRAIEGDKVIVTPPDREKPRTRISLARWHKAFTVVPERSEAAQ